MPRITASKDEIKTFEILPEGMYTVRLDGFKPKWSKDRGSINLNPDMRIINHPQFNDRPVFENLNTKGQFVWFDFCHAFGVPVQMDNGSITFPGQFGDDNSPEDPQQWPPYTGPLVGQVANVYLIQSQYEGKDQNKIKFYVCKLGPQCDVQGSPFKKHSMNLAK